MIAATFHSPNYSDHGPSAATIETHDSLGDVIEALVSRERSGNFALQHYTTLDGEEHAVLFPGVDEGARFECYELPEDFTHADGDLDRVLSIIGEGLRDWTLTLTRDPDTDFLGVMVVPA